MIWPFRKKKKQPSLCEEILGDDMPSLPSMAGVDVNMPTSFKVNRVDNGYIVFAYSYGGKGPGYNRTEEQRQMVFGKGKDVAKFIEKQLDKLEEEIKIEKLKQ